MILNWSILLPVNSSWIFQYICPQIRTFKSRLAAVLHHKCDLVILLDFPPAWKLYHGMSSVADRGNRRPMWQETWPAPGACTVAQRENWRANRQLWSHTLNIQGQRKIQFLIILPKNYRLKPLMTFISSSWTKNSLLVILAWSEINSKRFGAFRNAVTEKEMLNL